MKDLLKYALGGMAGLLVCGLILVLAQPPKGNGILLQAPPTPGPMIVHVSGAVAEPGVYAVPAGSRVEQAIQAAGGLQDEADLEQLNLAAVVEDGSRLTIPFKTPKPSPVPEGEEQVPTTVRSNPVSVLININTANQAELESLPGIGPVLAEQIIFYRNANGAFKTIDEIIDVPGIGPKTFEMIKDRITV